MKRLFNEIIAYCNAQRESTICNFEPFVNLLSSMVRESRRDYLRLLQSLDRKYVWAAPKAALIFKMMLREST